MRVGAEFSLSGLAPGETAARTPRPRLVVSMARTQDEVREAQRLRYQVFAEELGARLVVREPGIDQDFFDPYCDHLLVRDANTLQVVGTYRILAAANAMRIGQFYTDSEFDLVRLNHLRPRIAEVGRACIHADYRTGGAIMMLWSGLARYMQERGYEFLIGCASMSLADGGANAVGAYRKIARNPAWLAPVEYRVFPRHPLPLEAWPDAVDGEIPALLKGYLRLGAWVCGEPAWDPDFNTADLPILLPVSRLDGRYARHLLGEAVAA